MVFSLFGKKGESKKTENKAPASKAPAARPLPKPATPVEPVASPQEGEDLSLDFSSYVPPSQPASRAPEPAPPPAPQKLEAVPAAFDASALASSLAAEVMAAPASAMEFAPVPAPQPQAAAAPSQPPADAGASVETSSPASEIVPVIEETATLFANGQAEQALATLSRSVRETDLGESALRAWLMLFDLYQHLGMRMEFEALALELVVKFERSPPAWIESAESADLALVTGGIGYCALGGMLSDASSAELEKLQNAAGAQQSVRVDFSKLEGVDGAGCGLLREALLSLSYTGKEVMFTGETKLTELLEQACQPGRIETDGALWALLLDVYRMLDLKEKFEEAAVNYAVTFEVSPPSWEGQAGGVVKRKAANAVETGDHALHLSGEIAGDGGTLAKQLQDWAAANKMLLVDMTGARRVDRAAAGLMLDVLTALHRSGTTIQIRGTNSLIHALFDIVGIGRIARIVPRK